MLDVKSNCGVIPNFFSQDDVADMIKTFRSFPVVEYEGAGNAIYGVDHNHLAYLWFRRRCFKNIQQVFGDNIRLIFGMLLDCKQPFGIHHDLKPLPEAHGQHHVSFLIPYSVNNDPALVSHAATCVFNETMTNLDSMPVLANHAQHLSQDLAHVPAEQLLRFSLKQWMPWHTGDLLWWDSHLAHVSNDFRTQGWQSKQGIVIHSYVV